MCKMWFFIAVIALIVLGLLVIGIHDLIEALKQVDHAINMTDADYKDEQAAINQAEELANEE
jgi:hypothetical protein